MKFGFYVMDRLMDTFSNFQDHQGHIYDLRARRFLPSSCFGKYQQGRESLLHEPMELRIQVHPLGAFAWHEVWRQV